jgi:hypothetical protein
MAGLAADADLGPGAGEAVIRLAVRPVGFHEEFPVSAEKARTYTVVVEAGVVKTSIA